ncbi:hypothetical protein GCM10022217_20200 [Chryseobacterium ginsenosidimutans]|jgi:hypothetical protein|uniref:hypothetical protein n=1 Tax=Chryseobacterium ginsenosidimutans TaxID=687846 RepID=UPI0031DC50B3
MKKLFVIGAIAIGSIVSAFPFRSSCGTVFQINDWTTSQLTQAELKDTLSALNFNACGVHANIIIYSH